MLKMHFFMHNVSLCSVKTRALENLGLKKQQLQFIIYLMYKSVLDKKLHK